MNVSVTEAMARLDDLVHRAQAGEEVVLTDGDRGAVRLVPVRPAVETSGVLVGPADREARLREIGRRGRQKAGTGPTGARSQDFLYGEDGLRA